MDEQNFEAAIESARNAIAEFQTNEDLQAAADKRVEEFAAIIASALFLDPISQMMFLSSAFSIVFAMGYLDAQGEEFNLDPDTWGKFSDYDKDNND